MFNGLLEKFTNAANAVMSQARLLGTVGILTVLIGITGCTDMFGGAPVDPNGASNDSQNQVVIPETTKVADDDTRNALTSYSSQTGTMRFSGSTPVLQNLSKDDVLVSKPVGSTAPYGFLRKVTAVRQVGNEIVVETTQAALSEAIDQGRVQFKRSLTPSDVASADVTAGVQFDPQAQRTLSMPFHYDIDKRFEADDGTTARINGYVKFGIDLNYDLILGNLLDPVEYALAEIKPYEEVELSFTADREWNQPEKEIRLFRPKFGPFNIMVGPVPVQFTVIIDVGVGIKGEANLDVQFNVRQSVDYRFGFEREGGDWRTISESNKNFELTEPPERLDGYLNVRPFVAIKPGLLLYDMGAAKATVRLYLELDGKVPRFPIWKLYLGVQVGYEVALEKWSVSLVEKKDPAIIEERWSVGEAENTPPAVSLSVAHSASNDTRAVLLNEEVEFAADVGDLETGSTCPSCTITWQVSPNSGVSIDTQNNGRTAMIEFESEGSRTVTATAEDEQGATGEASLEVEVQNPLDIKITLPQGTTVYGGDGLTTTFQATNDAIRGVPISCEWRIDGQSYQGCSTEVVLPYVTSDRSISVSVTARDDLGNMDTTSLRGLTLASPPENYPVLKLIDKLETSEDNQLLFVDMQMLRRSWTWKGQLRWNEDGGPGSIRAWWILKAKPREGELVDYNLDENFDFGLPLNEPLRETTVNLARGETRIIEARFDKQDFTCPRSTEWDLTYELHAEYLGDVNVNIQPAVYDDIYVECITN